MNIRQFLTESSSNIIREGFWKAYGEPDLPMPSINETPMEDLDYFVKRLKFVEENLAKMTAYRGMSTCRICNCHNGSREYEFAGYRWPAGYKHYLLEHNVHPSEGFVKAIYNN